LVVVLRDSLLHLPAAAVRDSPLTPQQLVDRVWETMRFVENRRYLVARAYIDETVRPALTPIADSHACTCCRSPTTSPANYRPLPRVNSVGQTCPPLFFYCGRRCRLTGERATFSECLSPMAAIAAIAGSAHRVRTWDRASGCIDADLRDMPTIDFRFSIERRRGLQIKSST
jgi:acetyl esterase/lipase